MEKLDIFLYFWAQECFVSIYLSVNRSSWMEEARERTTEAPSSAACAGPLLPLLSQGCWLLHSDGWVGSKWIR